MPIKIGGKPPATTTSPAATTPTNLDTLGAGSPEPQKPVSGSSFSGFKAPGHQSSASYLMTGAAQRSAVDTVKAQQDLRSKLRGGARKFYLDPGQFARLYFLDGDVTGEGVFSTPMVNTHLMQIGGNWVDFICLKNIEGSCICCDSNADRSQPSTYQLYTVINTTPYTIKNGPRKGVTLTARLQLFAADVKTREKLYKKAVSRGGSLAGKMWQFSRTDKQSSRVGDDIEYIDAYPMQSVLAKYPTLGDVDPVTKKEGPTTLIDYATAFPVITNSELAALRPDLAQLAGWQGTAANYGAMPPTGGGGGVGDIGDDEIPF